MFIYYLRVRFCVPRQRNATKNQNKYRKTVWISVSCCSAGEWMRLKTSSLSTKILLLLIKINVFIAFEIVWMVLCAQCVYDNNKIRYIVYARAYDDVLWLFVVGTVRARQIDYGYPTWLISGDCTIFMPVVHSYKCTHVRSSHAPIHFTQTRRRCRRRCRRRQSAQACVWATIL